MAVNVLKEYINDALSNERQTRFLTNPSGYTRFTILYDLIFTFFVNIECDNFQG